MDEAVSLSGLLRQPSVHSSSVSGSSQHWGLGQQQYSVLVGNLQHQEVTVAQQEVTVA